MQCYLFTKLKGKVARFSIAGEAFLAFSIMPRALALAFISDALAPCFCCIENLDCLQVQEGDDDAFEEHLHFY